MNRKHRITIVGNQGYLGKQIQNYFSLKKDFIVSGFDHIDRDRFETQVGLSDIVILANGLSDHDLGRMAPFLDYQKNVHDYMCYLSNPILKGKKIIVLGSICQYGKLSGKVTEHTKQNPIEPQGENKYYIERALPYFSKKYDFRYCYLRLGAVVGRKLDLSNLSLFEKIIVDEINNSSFEVWGGSSRTYSYTLIEDFLTVLQEICMQQQFNNESYNLSLDDFIFSQLPVSNIQIIEKNIVESYSISSIKILEKLKLAIQKHDITKVVDRLRNELAELSNC